MEQFYPSNHQLPAKNANLSKYEMGVGEDAADAAAQAFCTTIIASFRTTISQLCLFAGEVVVGVVVATDAAVTTATTTFL
jgi:hypothetical protein